MRAIFIRHGLAESNIPSPDWLVGQHSELVDEGVEQVKVTARKLGHLAVSEEITPPDVIYTSPLERTHRSAKIIAEALGANVETDDRLREIHKGILEGRTVKEAIELEAALRQRSEIPEGSESDEEAGQRVAEVIMEKMTEGKRSVIIVSHELPIRMGVSVLTGQYLESELHNGSITILDYDGANWLLNPEFTNWTPEKEAE